MRKGPSRTVLVLGWFSCLVGNPGLVLTHSGKPVAYSQTLMGSGHSHNFHELIEVEEDDEISVNALYLDKHDTWESAWSARKDDIQNWGPLVAHLCVIVLA